jgi:cobalt-zinc-cadmium efflux system outer membrane protein
MLPPDTPESRPARLKAIDALFPELPPLSPDPVVDGLPGTKPVTLEELLDFARRNSPVISQAAADVADAQGRWVQVGLYPNPTIGAQADQIGDIGPYGQFGAYFNQNIVTAGKLGIARSVAFFDLLNAQVRLRRAEAEVAQRVRTNYYAALVAADTVRFSRLLAGLTDEVYRRQVALVRGGQAAPYEAAALLSLVGQAETTLAASRNRYVSAWKQLAAAVNAPAMPPAPLAGRSDAPLPRYQFEALQARLLATHTDIVVARNSITQAQRTVTREQVRPIPDVQNYWYFQRDTLAYHQQQPSFQAGFQIGVTVPLFDRNQGGIMSARAQLARATAEVPRVQNELIQRLADAYERYETARQQVELYRERILPNLVTAFRGVYQRYQVEPGQVNYNDVVTAQQNLVVQMAGYLQALQAQWQAVSDLAGVLQVIDIAELLNTPPVPAPETWPDATPRPLPTAPQPLPAPQPVPKKP